MTPPPRPPRPAFPRPAQNVPCCPSPRDVTPTNGQIPADLLASAWTSLSKWRDGISQGDLLDVYNSTEGEWYLGKVLHFEPPAEAEAESRLHSMDVESPEGGAGVESEAHVRIHYQGWPTK